MALWRQLKQLRVEVAHRVGDVVQPSYMPLPELKSQAAARARAELDRLLRSDGRIAFHCAQPLISVIVVVWNRAELTLRCLRALEAVSDPPFELIIVDNGSSDETTQLLARVDGARLLRRETNEGFVAAVNLAAQQARGDVLAPLNNDAEPLPGSLAAARRALVASEEIGAVVGPIVLLDGRLQEAGSIIWRDGSCAGYGRGEPPDEPWYGFQRDVDFGSAAFLLTRRSTFEELGGFDERFRPAYYEDVDYCVRLHRSGRRVLYVPEAVVRHFEFASSRSSDEAQALQRLHRQRFCERHAEWLAQQRTPADGALAARSRRRGKRVLFIDDRVPQRCMGSGFPRALDMLTVLSDAGCEVTLFTSVAGCDPHRGDVPRSVEIASGVGVPRLPDFLRARAGHYDCVVVSRPHNLGRLGRRPPGARLIYDAEALFAERDGAIAGKSPQKIRGDLEAELALARGADVVLVASPSERERFAAAAIAGSFRPERTEAASSDSGSDHAIERQNSQNTPGTLSA